VTIYVPDVGQREGPLYRAIAEAIADDIAAGRLAEQSRLPPHRDLAHKLGVTTGTVSRAYAELARRRLISGEVGRGSFVRAAGRPTLRAQDDAPAGVDLSRNEPATGPHEAALADALREIAAGPRLSDMLCYAPSAGMRRHREAGAAWFSRVGLEAPADRIVMCGGAQQGLALALNALRRDAPVLMESVTYCGLIEAARALNCPAEPVALDAEGMRPDALEEAVRKTGGRTVVVVPTLHNPTNAVMSEGRRRKIARLARVLDLTIIEDDVYGFVLTDRPPPIAAFAPERTLYIASASKALAPGLRVAWMAAPGPLVGPLDDAAHALNLTRPPLMDEIASLWIESGVADKLVRWQRQEAAARQAIAAEALDGFTLRGHPASFHVLLELPQPWRSDAFARAAQERGVTVVSLNVFAVSGEAARPAVRISLSAAPDRAALRQALDGLRQLALDSPRFQRAVI
jgi:DNA-binding transcriptional MocR family regulator